MKPVNLAKVDERNVNLAVDFEVVLAETKYAVYAEGHVFPADEQGQAIEVEVEKCEPDPPAPSEFVQRELNQIAAEKIIAQFKTERGEA